MGKPKSNSWKTGGNEDTVLIDLIKNGKVTKHTKPTELKKMNEIFKKHSDSAIRNHLNEMKRRQGLHLIDFESNAETNEEYAESAAPVQQNEVNEDYKQESSLFVMKNEQELTIKQYPYVCGTFKNAEDEVDMVFVGISIPGGAKNVRFDLETNGLIVHVKFDWPATMYDAKDMFKKELANGMQLYHPMVLSFKNELQNVREMIDLAPTTEFTISLPMKVETSPNSWTKEGITREDGTLVIKATFRGFVKNYNKKALDNTVTFSL